MSTCRATTNKGAPCPNETRPGSKYCWHHRDSPTAFWPQSILISLLSVAVGFGLAVGYDSYKTKQEIRDRKALRQKLTPTPIVVIEQVNNTMLKVSIDSTNAESAVINNLFFTLDIPGTFVETKDKDIRNISDLSVSSVWQYSSGGIIAMERVNVNLDRLYSNGHGSFRIVFEPPQEKVYQVGSTQYTNKPKFSDLRDFIWVNYFWTFNGEDIKETFPLNLRHLPMVIDDNKALIKVFRNEDFHQQTGTPLGPHEEIWDDDYVLKYERKRASLPEN